MRIKIVPCMSISLGFINNNETPLNRPNPVLMQDTERFSQSM